MSTDFIKILVNEHHEIRDIFGAIDAAGDLSAKKDLVQRLQAILAPHLRKEDTELYPVLIASSDQEVRRMANIFHLTMEAYAENFAVIANKIFSVEGGDIPADIAVDYKNVRDRIKDRITIEEVTIFPAYEKFI